MKTLLIYATNSGSTLEVANYITSDFSQKNQEIKVEDVRNITPETFNDYDLVILGAPTWGEGELLESFSRVIEKFTDKKFPDKKFAVFGLGDSTYAHFCGAADQLENFVKNVEGKLIAPVLKIDNFYFNQQQEIPKISEWVKRIFDISS
jgi:flavodoxin I